VERGVRLMMRTAQVRLAGELIAVLLFAAPIVRAQDAAMSAAAPKMADAISHAKQRTVVVFDFTGPGAQLTGLGKRLADDFSAALAKSAQKFQVEDRSRVDEQLKADLYPADIIILDPQSMQGVAQDLRANAFVIGQLSLDQDKLSVTLTAYRTSGGREVKALQVSWTLTEEMKGLSEKNLLEADPATGSTKYPVATGKGISPPQCKYCPNAAYSPEALDHNFQGTVQLMVIVGEDGSIRNIRIVKAMPYGLTAQAISAVRNWKLVPAKGPDGNPMSVRQIIEVTFQFH
jgi:TonB family protein